MAFADADGIKLYYESHGDGPALVLVHGSGGHHAAWWQQVPYFARWFRVIALDLRGFGNSDSIPDGPDSQDFVKDIRAVIDHAGLDRAVLLGQSIGAAPALRLAVQSPDRVAGVVLAHSIGGIDDEELRSLVQADRKKAEQLPVLDRLLSKDFQLGRPELTFLFRQMGTFNHAKMQDLRNLSAKGPSVQDVVASKVPILFLCGEKDAVLPASTVLRAHKKIPGSHFAAVPNGPHSLYWEKPEIFNSEVHRFLNKVYAQP